MGTRRIRLAAGLLAVVAVTACSDSDGGDLEAAGPIRSPVSRRGGAERKRTVRHGGTGSGQSAADRGAAGRHAGSRSGGHLERTGERRGP